MLLIFPLLCHAEPELAPAGPVSSTSYPDFFRLTLTGDPQTATALVEEELGVIPFGKWLNAIPSEKVQHGVKFSAQLAECSSFGCTVETENSRRVLVAKRGMADGIKIDIFEAGWKRVGSSAISEGGQLAIPVAGPDGNREVWIIRSNGRMRKRIPHSISGATLLRWHSGGLYMIYQDSVGLKTMEVSLNRGALTPAPLLDAWWATCEGGPETPLAVGMAGEIFESLKGYLTIPLYRRGDPQPGVLVLTQSVRPATTQGYASPTLVKIDCFGRINVVTAQGDEVWCLRFGADGHILKAGRIFGDLAGDAKGVKIDQRGRFYYLEVEMGERTRQPYRLHLMRLK